MKFINNIYRKRAKTVFILLAVYFNLLTVTALHYHSVDLNVSGISAIETKDQNKNSYSVSALQCPVYNFSFSVFQFFVTEKSINSVIDAEIFTSINDDNTLQFLNKDFQSLRAPPKFI